MFRGMNLPIISELHNKDAVRVLRVQKGPRTVILKRVTVKSSVLGAHFNHDANNEVGILTRCSSIPQYVAALISHSRETSSGNENLYLLLEDGGIDLAQVLRQALDGPSELSAITIRFFALGMLRCLSAIHSRQIIHMGR